MLIALHKPFGVLSRFTPELPGQRTLAECGLPPRVYPVGRLDRDSEGLLLLTDEPRITDRLLDPRHAHPRTYHVLVEGVPSSDALARLARGIVLDDKPTRPCRAALLPVPPPHLPRQPPVRTRKSITDSWLELILTEGRNRQVRRMTAAVGHPTLRLVRVAIGRFPLTPLACGQWRELDTAARDLIFQHV